MTVFLPALTPAVDANGEAIPQAVWHFLIEGTTTPANVSGGSDTVTADNAGEFDAPTLASGTDYRAQLKTPEGRLIAEVASAVDNYFSASFKVARDDSNNLLSGASWDFRNLSGVSIPVYADPELAVSLGSTVYADASGRFPQIYLDPTLTYAATLRDSALQTVATLSPVNTNTQGAFLDPEFLQEISPSADYDGTAGTGFGGEFEAVPTDPTRTTAKPGLRLLVPDYQWFNDELLVGVSAMANDSDSLFNNFGMESVEFILEGSKVTVTSATAPVFNDANGNAVSYPGFWAKLKRPEGVTGEVNLYLRGTANDGTMQQRVMGPYSFTMVATEAEIFQQDVTVRADGTGDYTTIQAAWNAVSAASGVENARITVTEGGTYEGVKVSGVAFTANPKGRIYLEASEPVTIGFATFAGDNANEFDTRHPMWARGSNITFDMANITHFEHDNQTGRSNVFDGVNFIDSAGGFQRDGLRNTPGITEGVAWFLECDVQGCFQPYRLALLVRGGTTVGGAGDVLPEVACSTGHTVSAWNNVPFWEEKLALTVTGPANSTLSLSGGNNAATRTLTAKEGASTVGTFTIERSDTAWIAGTNYTVENVIAWINGLSGWSATANPADSGTHPRRANLLGRKSPEGGPYYKGAAFTDVDCSGGLELVTTGDIHSDLMAYNQVNENIIHHNLLAYGMQSQLFWLTHPSGFEDLFLVNVAGENGELYPGYTGYRSALARAQSHVVIAHCTLSNQELQTNMATYNADGYCAIFGGALQRIVTTTTFDPDLAIVDCVIDAGETIPSTATGTVAAGTAASKFVSPSTGNFAPKVGGELLANLVTARVRSDINGNTRAASDAAGAVAS